MALDIYYNVMKIDKFITTADASEIATWNYREIYAFSEIATKNDFKMYKL